MSKKVESNETASSFVTASEIHENDVLFGRGKKVHANEGNRRFRLLIWERLPGNAPANKPEKRKSRTAFTKEIVAIVHQRQGRFLKVVESSDDSQWKCVELSVVLTKVKQALRDAEAKQVTKNASGHRIGSSLGELGGHVPSPQISPNTNMPPMGLGTASTIGTDPLLSRYLYHRNGLVRQHQVWAQLQSQASALEQARQKQVLLLALAGQMEPEHRHLAPFSFQQSQRLAASLAATSTPSTPLFHSLRNDLSVDPSFWLARRTAAHMNSSLPSESQGSGVEVPFRDESCSEPPSRPQGHADNGLG